MTLRSLAAIMVLLSLVRAGIGLWIVRVVFQSGDGAVVLGVFAGVVAVTFGTYVALAPVANCGPWTTTDTVTWLLAVVNVLVLAAVSWQLTRLARVQRRAHERPLPV